MWYRMHMDHGRSASAEAQQLRERALAMLEALPQRTEALALGLCGSVARGEAGPASDIDVLVVVADTSPPELDLYWWQVLSRAMAPLGRPVSTLVYTPAAILRVANWHVLRLARDAVLAHDPADRAADLLRRVLAAAERAGFHEVLVDGRPTWRKPAAQPTSGPAGADPFAPFELRADE